MNSWEELKQECLQCHACSLAETRTNVVFGVGTPQAEVVIVGEAPLNTEKEACSGYLRRQMELMQPKILVCLGRISAMEMIKPDFKITREHGQFFEKDGIQMMALYHPAALLRDPHKKPETFEDLKRLQAKIREICDHTPLDF